MRSNWWVDYVNEPVTPLYPFGYGLSYTEFEYRDISISAEEVRSGDIVDVSFTITNTGEVAGDEVPQLYIKDFYASTPRPVKELKAFTRIRLAAGESKKVTFHVPVDMFAFINNDLELALEKGRVYFMVGSSSEDLHLRGAVEVVEDRILPLMDRVFKAEVTVS